MTSKHPQQPQRFPIIGVHHLYSILLEAFPWPTDIDPEASVMVLTHFGPLYIMVDESSGDTRCSIANWSFGKAVPRFLGWAAFPNFLLADWEYEMTSTDRTQDDGKPSEHEFTWNDYRLIERSDTVSTSGKSLRRDRGVLPLRYHPS
ncbi:hypothetical protein GTA08_BOTSDO14102 [Botryosphaeria dothidea]|uniref:Uncharacterized protein n=1 Tax=Botryosphaeria dothidea TaxID=55169 RepID=A0A8H4IJX7_9PEZI|nr:hypothetical protein GTA08_BOTSDO09935 [Botryosphaeria dothidea]KAF4307384.1 hypothetical protein GTA08_BOTSDO14102 [Botryosphaeria dothidea]